MKGGNSEKLKVLFVSSWYPCRVTPTNGNFIQRHAEAVAQYCDVASLFAISDKNISSLEITEEEINGVHTVIVYYPKSGNIPLLTQLVKYRKYLAALNAGYEKIEKQWGTPSIIHGNVLSPCGAFVRKLSEQISVPYIFTEHWSGYLPANRSKLTKRDLFVSKYAVAKAKYICPVSENLAQNMQPLGIKGNYKVIANVVNESIFLPKRKSATSKKKLLHISNLDDRVKNISGIIKAVKLLSQKKQDFEMLIAGDGNPKPHQDFARSLNISDDILKIEGEKSLPEVARLMNEANMLVMFSHYENLPCVISEAHVTGIPVVATNVGGIPEMMDESNGMLVETGDEKALADAIDSILNRLTGYDSQKIREKAVARYGKNVIGKKYFDLYRDALK